MTITSKSQAYKIALSAGIAGQDKVGEALAFIARKAAIDSMTFIGLHKGAEWMRQNRAWMKDESNRSIIVIQRAIGRSLTGSELYAVRNVMNQTIKGAA